MAKTPKYNYQVTIEIPRTLNMGRNGTAITVDRMTQCFYSRKNKESVLRSFGSVKNLATLRKQGFRITRAEYKKYKNRFLIERI